MMDFDGLELVEQAGTDLMLPGHFHLNAAHEECNPDEVW